MTDLNDYVVEMFIADYKCRVSNGYRKEFLEKFFEDGAVNSDYLFEVTKDYLYDIPDRFHKLILNTLNWEWIEDQINAFHKDQ